MLAKQIRQSFIDFFRTRGHAEVGSASLVPGDDPTLLFTNAGMVQFKRVFQGLEGRDYRRAVTVQKCVRAGGKHNDLEEVGRTTRHHTFFEMLGNFSFGDYFKRDAIAYAWEWVIGEEFLGIEPDRLYFTVHHTDKEAADLWHQVTGVDRDRIYGLGDKDNFWQMGDTGPCGPCSEIFVDLRPAGVRRAASGSPTLAEFEALGEAGQLLEIWNLVFMQFDQAKDGSRTPLPAPSVDTGAGLERIAAVIQGVPSNFDTDLFAPLLSTAASVVGKAYDSGEAGVGYRVLADHARAVAFLLADGLYPSNEGRGYVLRRILRRAVRHAYLLGRTEPTLVHLAETVVETMGDVYPELKQNADEIVQWTRAEEEGFLRTIADGLARLEEMTTGTPGTIEAEDAFRLYDTFGFPIDLTVLTAGEKGWQVDVAGFERELEAQRARSRQATDKDKSSWQESAEVAQGQSGPAIRTGSSARKWITHVPRKRQRFVGYETTRAGTDILKYRRVGDRVELILHENPFYAESGGQVSDVGRVQGEGWQLEVDRVFRDNGRQVVAGSFEGPFDPTPVEAAVAEERRRDIERNHTATHLVHAALRTVLGPHVRQAGSVVAPDRLRFDFSHHSPVTDEELLRIEEDVNAAVWHSIDIATYQMDYRDALAKGAMALFGEKYGDRVRVVDIPGVSLELCGGTHVRTTGQIGLFRFTGETGVAAGVRRIEAVTGPGAYETVRAIDERLQAAAETLRTNPEHLSRKIDALLQERKRLEKQVDDLLRSGGGSDADFRRHELNGVIVMVGETSVSDRHQVGLIMDAFREQHDGSVAVLIVTGDRPGIHVAVTDDLIGRGLRAGDVVKKIAALAGGSGGGRPHFASAGVGNVEQLAAVKTQAPEVVRALLPA